MALETGTHSLAREVAGWVLVAVVAVGCFMFFTDIQAMTRQLTGIDPDAVQRQAAEAPAGSAFDRTVTIQAAENGHFYTTATVNGRDVDIVVDTGATAVALTYEDAEKIGLSIKDSDFTQVSQTANGQSRVAPVTIDEIRIGDISVKNVECLVTEPGVLFQSLLGMTFLRQLSRMDIRGRELVLEQ
jgi:aspartyl protease family protein